MASKNKNKAAEVVQKSPAEFFAENKNIAGFDNVSTGWGRATHLTRRTNCTLMLLPPCPQPGKSLYTTIRELVENALDSAESISELPHIEITM